MNNKHSRNSGESFEPLQREGNASHANETPQPRQTKQVEEKQLIMAAMHWNEFLDKNGSFAEEYSTL